MFSRRVHAAFFPGEDAGAKQYRLFQCGPFATVLPDLTVLTASERIQ